MNNVETAITQQLKTWYDDYLAKGSPNDYNPRWSNLILTEPLTWDIGYCLFNTLSDYKNPITFPLAITSEDVELFLKAYELNDENDAITTENINQWYRAFRTEFLQKVKDPKWIDSFISFLTSNKV